MRVLRTDISRARRTAAAVFALGLCLTLFTPFAPRAQRKQEQGANVTGVAARATERGAVVSITGDAPLARAQTWQDDEGFHIVGYKWSPKFSGAPRGVKIRRVGDSLEMVVPVRRGGSVSVHPRTNALDIVVSGDLDSSADTEGEAAQGETRRRPADATTSAGAQNDGAARRTGRRTSEGPNALRRGESSGRADAVGRQTPPARVNAAAAQHVAAAQMAVPGASAAAGVAAQQQSQSQQPVPSATAVQSQSNFTETVHEELPSVVATPEMAQAVPDKTVQAEVADAERGSSLLLTVTLLVLVFTLLFGFLYFRSRRHDETPAADVSASASAAATPGAQPAGEAKAKPAAAPAALEAPKPAGAKQEPATESRPLVRRETSVGAHALAQPPILFGALRIEQEVGKLVRGEAHSVEVLASRASDDRRAVEAALLKSIKAQDHAEGERARARRALEEYGFVARSAAALLCASDVFERSSAARVLGAVRSPASLPFLLEALYDAEPVVRAESVASLGALGLPSAIGALLDLARRHPDIPPQLLGGALSACSVDCIEVGARDASSLAGADWFDGEIAALEPVAEIEQLPEWLEDETLADALERLSSADVEARVAAAQQLSHFSVASSVKALAAMASGDPDSSVRAAAVTSLGHIGHETVFAPVLIAMADEAREVRAAAARSLSRLSFDRADAYVRVLDNSDAETMRRLTDACVTAGLARQALDRLASDDRRQAYEAFSLLSLVARGGGAGVILSAVESHPDLNSRVAAARLLALQGEPQATERLRRIAADPRTPERLRTAIGEVVTRGVQHPAEAARALGDRR